MTCIAFYNGKGGCGKTTAVFNIAGVYARQGKRILVIDLDKQRNSSELLLYNNEDVPRKSIYDFLLGKADFAKTVAKAYFEVNRSLKYFGVDVSKSDVRLENQRALSRMDMKSAAVKIKEYADNEKYDYILIDMPPSNKAITDFALKLLAEKIAIPISPENFSLDGYSDTIDIINEASKENSELETIGAFFSRIDMTHGNQRYIERQMRGVSSYTGIKIPYLEEIEETITFRKPISFLHPTSKKSKGRIAYEALAKRIG